MRIVPWSDRKAGKSRRSGRRKAEQTSRLAAASWKVLPLLKLFPELDWVLYHSWHLKASLTDTWGTNTLEVQKDGFCAWLRELEARLSLNLRACPCLNFIWLVANYNMNLHSTALGTAMHLSQNRVSDWNKIQEAQLQSWERISTWRVSTWIFNLPYHVEPYKKVFIGQK